MAPILSLLRSMAERGLTARPPSSTARGRKKDLCFELNAGLEEKLPDFTYVPALSEPGEGDDWDGEIGLITDVVKRHASDLRGAHAYVCGPPPMVEAAMALLATLGVEKSASTTTSSPPPATRRSET